MPGVLEWLAARDSFGIVQIGAFVGASGNDPLWRFMRAQAERDDGSVALFVEPVRSFFEELVRNYEGLPFARFENVAVAEAPGTRDLYRLAVDPVAHGFPPWMAQLGSLREDWADLWEARDGQGPRHEFYREHRTVERVECITFDQLIDRNGILSLDLLQLDTEGYDYQILRTVDFERIRPRFVNYEREWLGADEEACRAMMREAGYALFDWGHDTLCVLVAE